MEEWPRLATSFSSLPTTSTPCTSTSSSSVSLHPPLLLDLADELWFSRSVVPFPSFSLPCLPPLFSSLLPPSPPEPSTLLAQLMFSTAHSHPPFSSISSSSSSPSLSAPPLPPPKLQPTPLLQYSPWDLPACHSYPLLSDGEDVDAYHAYPVRNYGDACSYDEFQDPYPAQSPYIGKGDEIAYTTPGYGNNDDPYPAPHYGKYENAYLPPGYGNNEDPYPAPHYGKYEDAYLTPGYGNNEDPYPAPHNGEDEGACPAPSDPGYGDNEGAYHAYLTPANEGENAEHADIIEEQQHEVQDCEQDQSNPADPPIVPGNLDAEDALCGIYDVGILLKNQYHKEREDVQHDKGRQDVLDVALPEAWPRRAEPCEDGEESKNIKTSVGNTKTSMGNWEHGTTGMAPHASRRDGSLILSYVPSHRQILPIMTALPSLQVLSCNEQVEMKEHLKVWAHAVASTVHWKEGMRAKQVW